MKYGFAFALFGSLCVAAPLTLGWWAAPLVWLGAAYFVVSAAYLGLGVWAFGKSASGKRSRIAAFLLWPYLSMAWLVWRCSIVASREPAFAKLDDSITIGRRLRRHEFPSDVEIVVDLTCEFSPALPESPSIRCVSYPILDAGVPDSAEQLIETLRAVLGESKPIYIHCAQGHGRTALVACCFLLASNKVKDVETAIGQVLEVRPLARMNTAQTEWLHAKAERLRSSAVEVRR